MSKFLASITLIFTFIGFAFSQDQNANETRKELAAKIVAFLNVGKLEDAIEFAEKLVKLEESVNSQDTVSLTNSILNLARMKRDVFLILLDYVNSGKFSGNDRAAAINKMLRNAKEADALYRRALLLNEQGGRAEIPQVADIKGELGILISKYLGSKISIDTSEKFLLESISLNEKVRGNDAYQTLFVVLKTGDFYNEKDNYEKAQFYFEKYIETTEQKEGKNSPNLVIGLRPLAQILFTSFQDQEAGEVIKRIESITKKSEPLPNSNADFYARSKDAVALRMKIVPQYREEVNSLIARLTVENRTLNSNSAAGLSSIKTVRVNVVINEDGKVIEAKADNLEKDEKLRKRAEEEVLKWTVRPYFYKNTKRKIRGVLRYLELD